MVQIKKVRTKYNVGSIKDSGHRREFPTGAVRDIVDGKGRCDLMPLHEVAGFLGKEELPFTTIIGYIAHAQDFINKKDYDTAVEFLYSASRLFTKVKYWTVPEAVLELSKHYEQGAKKYGENNWQKGIEFKSYIDSAVRHLLKYMDLRKDERHDRAFLWNIISLIWTINNREVLNAGNGD